VVARVHVTGRTADGYPAVVEVPIMPSDTRRPTNGRRRTTPRKTQEGHVMDDNTANVLGFAIFMGFPCLTIIITTVTRTLIKHKESRK
jgi:hypothetical protein